ncbi:DNA primase [uncultured Limosilactobacillus sp.]|uniref:DNA primase n=1 Tax=uncultured Limosilactobacillus sp. TaxID=2837629 RepID=UPI0025F7E29D|nr:DNA primase [uncultured Limosilactobacillus sp.]
MAKISRELIDQVRHSVDIVDVIGQYVQLRPAGKSLMGLCPFHDERTPSFSVDEKKQLFYCFSCHRGGNVFHFLEDLKNEGFLDALREVAAMANISLPATDNNIRRQQVTDPQAQRKQQLIEVHQLAMNLYHHILMNTPAGEPARQYLAKRGMSRELIEQFHIGFAPQKRVLKAFLADKKVDSQLLQQSGLFVNGQNGLSDRFSSRVMFPLLNSRGKPIAFSGRLLAKNANLPKYLNSPETILFQKSSTLFNLDQAKSVARKSGKLYLFEGFMDVISAFGANVHNGVASLGTSLTGEQVDMISRLTNQVDICYDGDRPGQQAIERALKLFEDESQRVLQLRVVQLPAGIDPDEYVQQYGGEQFREYLQKNEETPAEFRLRYLRQGVDLSNQNERLNYLNAALNVIAGVGEPLARDMYVGQLATEFNLDREALNQQLGELLANRPQRQPRRQSESTYRRPATAARQGATQSPAPVGVKLTRLELAEQLLLHTILHDPEAWATVVRYPNFRFVTATFQEIYQVAAKIKAADPDQEITIDRVMGRLADQRLAAQLSEVESRRGSEVLNDQGIADCLKVITQQQPIEERIRQKKAELAEASAVHNDELESKLVNELIDLFSQREKLKTEEIG